MRFFMNSSLKLIIYVGLIIGTSIPLLIGAHYFEQHIIKEYDKTIDRDFENFSQMFVHSVEHLLWQRELETLKAIAKIYMENTHVLEIRLTDVQTGEEVFYGYKPGLEARANEEELEVFDDVFSTKTIEIEHEGNKIGKALIRFSKVNFVEEIEVLTTFMLQMSFVKFIISLALATLVVHYKIFKPLSRLMGYSERLSQRDLEKPFVMEQKDELGKLGHRMELTRVSLQNLFSELEMKNNELSEQNNQLDSISKKLSKYLSPQLYENIFTGRTDVNLESKRKKLTVFFSDIVGFTNTTEKLEPEELSGQLNCYLNAMTEIALSHGGTVDKYIGDAILVFFGDPRAGELKRMHCSVSKWLLRCVRKYWSCRRLHNKRVSASPFMFGWVFQLHTVRSEISVRKTVWITQ